MKPSRLTQAQLELQTINDPNFELPSEIRAAEKHLYHCIGIKAKDSADRMSKVHQCSYLYSTQKKWNEMKRQVTKGTFGGVFAGMFHKVVILHDPNDKVKEEPKKLSPSIKGKIKKLHTKGETAEEIADMLDADLALVKAYIDEKLNK